MSNLARMAAAKAAAEGGSSTPSAKPFVKGSPATPSAMPYAEGPARLYDLRQMIHTYRKVNPAPRRPNANKAPPPAASLYTEQATWELLSMEDTHHICQRGRFTRKAAG